VKPFLTVLLLAAAATAVAPDAHHGSADYHVDREVTVTGVVREWRWTNPHTWVFLDARAPGGTLQQWSGEGPPLPWAAQRGWSASTLRAGEEVSVVMYPGRREARSGLVKRIQRANGEILLVSRPWLDGR
jgi:hypothetical protein